MGDSLISNAFDGSFSSLKMTTRAHSAPSIGNSSICTGTSVSRHGSEDGWAKSVVREFSNFIQSRFA